ncbi:MAG: Protein translocase subunit YajC [Candidatus Bipolaricaulis sibiricus]|uniref:Protein translocase subunit YajC n=1 Tax=Bipolaricaulis sibiricus TaxID=2501609 RepID=A0A410FV36_BIPS1|nr:MAG: Protein translocase subunit YajC [Candidatus Bipolaricaulis sibiricus]
MDDPQTSQSMITLVVMLVAFAAIFYFLLIRPQRRRQKEHRDLLGSLKRGDRVITAGGIFGTIEEISEDSVTLTVEEGKLRLSKGSIVDKVRK